MSKRSIIREGRVCHEYNVKVIVHPEQRRLKEKNLTQNDINHLLGTKTTSKSTSGHAGLRLELKGYGRRKTVLLKWEHLPYVEVWRPRPKEEPFIDESFDLPANEAGQLRKLQRDLHFAKGDPVAYVTILMNYYRSSLIMLKKKNSSVPTANSEVDFGAMMRAELATELDDGE